MPNPEVDQDKCIGCGACVSVCSDVFELGDDGKAHVKDENACDTCDCEQARDNCPVNAISL